MFKFVDLSDEVVRSKIQSNERILSTESFAIMRLSQLNAPKQSGNLRQSHRVDRVGEMHYQISANTPYAARRHFENRKNPGTLRYLERAGDQITKTLKEKIK